MRIVLDHAVGVDAETRLAARGLLQPRPDVHAGGVPPQEERLVGLLGVGHEADRLLGDLVVDGLHPLLVERAGALDPLRAIRVGPGMDHAAGAEALAQRRILEVVLVLGLVLGVQVVERALEFLEAVRGRQVLVEVAQVVLAELPGHVALRLEQLGNGDVTRLQPLLGAGQADLQQAGAEWRLAGDERGAAGGAALLAVPVGEERAFLGDAIDVRRLVAHHALVVGAEVPVADVVAPEDEDVGLLWWRLCECRHCDTEHHRKSANAQQPFVHLHQRSRLNWLRLTRTQRSASNHSSC